MSISDCTIGVDILIINKLSYKKKKSDKNYSDTSRARARTSGAELGVLTCWGGFPSLLGLVSTS